ncbi:putative uncharacterized protein DDB_G0282133 [Hydra vulgaris]|uniref:putative uncharacterized protein DDB_G0282133 n=1 Tax=Hydra vulgaris TaxID=6087 RepID=UPI001F5E5FDA|nr:putative uncharacterized protein DDB_G0282133 [Hydra vulgaris]
MTNSETYEDDEENSAPRSSYSTYLAEGAILFKQGEFKKAIESYSLALEIKENDPTCLVARSKCYLKLGDPQKALQDAETVLSQNKDSIKGLCQKAEALYCIGDFEYALVYYHRGHKLCPELDEFRLGIQKAQEAIENSIGKAAKIKLEAKGDLSFFSKQDDFSTKKRGLLKQTPLIQIKPPIANRNKDVKLLTPSKKTVKQLLGELYADKEYLERLINDDRFLKKNTKSPIYDLVQGGLNFLETRTEFWRQQRPIYARKKEVRKLKSTVKKKSKSDVGKYVLQQLEDIDHALGNFDPERGLRLAKNLLNFTKEIDEKELPHKTEVIANAHSCIGNALIDLDELPKALKHHQRDLQISKISQSDSIGISRALGNIGRVKARMGKFEDAIQSWEEKMQYIKTPLEATWLYHELGRSYLELNSLDTALSYGLKSLAAAKEGNDEFWQLNANVLIAQAYGNQKNFESSIAAFEKALSLADITGDKIAKTAITKAINDTKAKSEIYACDNLANSSNEQIKLDCQISSKDLDENMFNSGELSNDYKQKINNTKNVYTECSVTEQLNECDETEQLNEVDSFFDHTYQDDIQHCESLDCTTNMSGNNSNIITESPLNTIISDQMSYESPRSEKDMNLSNSDANVSCIYDGNSLEEAERDESKNENFTGKSDDTSENIFKNAPEVKRIDVQLEENNALVLKSDLTPSLGLILENFLPGKEIDFIETRINATHTEHLINEIHTEHLINVTCNELQINETCTENLVNEIHTEHLVDEVHTEHRINETCIELQINETHTKHSIDETHTEHRNNETYDELQINETYIEHKVNETHTEHQINKVLKIEAHAEPPLGETNVEPSLGETNAEQRIITTEKSELSDQVFNYETSFQTSYTVTSNEPSNLLVLESSIMSDENLKTVNLNTTTHYENESLCNESITFTENLTAVNDILIACNENKELGDESLYNENSTPFIENDIEFNKNERKCSLNIITCNKNEATLNQNETARNENETPRNENETACNENETACNENESVNFNNIKTPSEDLIQCKDNETASNESLLFCNESSIAYNESSIAYNEKRNASALDLQSEVEDQLTNKNNNDQRLAIASHHTANYERNSITKECEIANNYERNSATEDCEITKSYKRNSITEDCEITNNYERNTIAEGCEIAKSYECNSITEDCEIANNYERSNKTEDCEIANNYERNNINEDFEMATNYEHNSTTKDCEISNNYKRNSIAKDCEIATKYEHNSATKDCEIANNYERNSITEDYEIANNYQHSKTNEITIDKSN